MPKSKYKFLLLGSKKYKKSSIAVLVEEAKKRFASVLFVPINKIKIVCKNGKTKLYYKDTDLTTFDACYPRLLARDFVMGEIVLDLLAESNVFVPVSAEAFQLTNHKYYTVQALNKIHAPVPDSSLSVSPEAADELVSEFGFPVVVKLLSGFAGKGVMLIQNKIELKSIFDTLKVFNEFISAQKFVPNPGKDLRCYVIGDKVISVRRAGAEGEWRANISRGGRADMVDVPESYKVLALTCSKSLGMDICAVDMMETEKGPVVIEINFCPGPFFKYLGNTIAREMMEFMHFKVNEIKAEKTRKKR